MRSTWFWRKMTQGKILEGVFGEFFMLGRSCNLLTTSTAINKPTGISSASVLRHCQDKFNPSKTFAPWIELETHKWSVVNHNQRQRRRQKKVQVKIGHGGTLDPLATGVLIAGVGKGTKELQGFLACTKTYETVVLFGASTDTYDRVGKILKRAPHQHITREMVEKALGQFRGKIMQLPPLYSALKMNGKPLYEYAREGKEIPREIEKRPVEVLELELLEWMEGGSHEHKYPEDEAGEAEKDVAERLWKQEKEQAAAENVKKETDIGPEGNLEVKKRKLEESQDALVSDRPAKKLASRPEEAVMSGGLEAPAADEVAPNDGPTSATKERGPPAAKLRMTVTSGFYVRSLCHDLGEAVGSQAIMAELVRTRQGDFELGKNVLEYEDLDRGEEVWAPKVEAFIDSWNEKATDRANANAGITSAKKEDPKAPERTTIKTEEELPKDTATASIELIEILRAG
jgi:tRNA pseudouridine55 synthase